MLFLLNPDIIQMKRIIILGIFSLLFLACGKKNPTKDFYIFIPYPDSFQPKIVNLGEGDEYTSVLYDISGDVKQYLVISKYYYRSSKMFSEKNIREVTFNNSKWLHALHDLENDEEMKSLLGKEHHEFIRILPEIEPTADLPVIKMMLNVNNQYGRRLESTFKVYGRKENFPTVIHALHHKERYLIIYLQYFRIRNGEGETLESYAEMMNAIENTRFF